MTENFAAVIRREIIRLRSEMLDEDFRKIRAARPELDPDEVMALAFKSRRLIPIPEGR